MSLTTGILIAAVLLFFIFAMPRMWRWFVHVTDEAIAKSYEDFRRRGITFDEHSRGPRDGGRR